MSRFCAPASLSADGRSIWQIFVAPWSGIRESSPAIPLTIRLHIASNDNTPPMNQLDLAAGIWILALLWILELGIWIFPSARLIFPPPPLLVVRRSASASLSGSPVA